MHIPIDTSASISPLFPAATLASLIANQGQVRLVITAINLQGVGSGNTIKFQNADDNSDIDTVVVDNSSATGGSFIWVEVDDAAKAGKVNTNINLVLSGATRVVGSVDIAVR